MKRRIFPALIFWTILGALWAAEKPLHLNVLAVGNSYDRNMAASFPQWVEHSGKGHTLDLTVIYMGGGSLEEHWQSVLELSGKAPAAHKKTRQQDIPLLAALAQKNWDYVTLHQVSGKSPFIDTYEPFLGNLARVVKQYAPEARIAFYQTWAYRTDHAYFSQKNISPQAMQQGIVDAYAELSRRYDAPVIPVGEVFRKVLEKRPFVADADFDYKNPATGKSPSEKNSLHVGAYRDAKTKKFTVDSSHANAVGQYLIGGTWYAVLYNETPVGNPYRPKGMSEEDARFYQAIIAEVTQSRRISPPVQARAEKAPVDFSKEKAALARLKAGDKKDAANNTP